MGGGGSGCVCGSGKVDFGCLGWTAGVGEDGREEARVGGSAGGGRWLRVGNACRRSRIGTVDVYRL